MILEVEGEVWLGVVRRIKHVGLKLGRRVYDEIEIHGTWIQYHCVRSGTVDLGYYYVRGRIGNLDTVF